MANKKNKTKSAPKILKVILEDGTIIQEKTATETYVEAIRQLGPYGISQIENIKVEGLPLVVSKKDYRMQLREVNENWYVATHMATDAKKECWRRLLKP